MIRLRDGEHKSDEVLHSSFVDCEYCGRTEAELGSGAVPFAER